MWIEEDRDFQNWTCSYSCARQQARDLHTQSASKPRREERWLLLAGNRFRPLFRLGRCQKRRHAQ